MNLTKKSSGKGQSHGNKANSVVMTTFILAILLLGTSWRLNAWNNFKHLNVDDIYNSIKNSDKYYAYEESIVAFDNEGMNLVSTLTIPRIPQKCPIIIILNGFTGNRNDAIIPGTNEPFFERASRRLAENGIASLRIDFRGSGESEGEYSMTSFSTQISDTKAAIDYINNELRHRVNTRSIGLIGYSQGGLVAAVVAARDKRVNSVVLWSPVASPTACYEGLLTKEGLRRGIELNDGEVITLGMYADEFYLGDITLGKGFFIDIFKIDPVAEIMRYKNPLMIVAGKGDIIVWPQPYKANLFLTYHNGFERLIEVDGGHSFNFANGSEGPDNVFFWSTAWFIKTLN